MAELADQRTRLERLDDYLKTLVTETWIDDDMRLLTLKVINDFRQAYPLFPVPNAGPTEAGHIILNWNQFEPHYLEIEVTKEGVAEFFYKNRETKFLDGVDIPIGEAA